MTEEQVYLIADLICTVAGWQIGRSIWRAKGADPARGKWYGAILGFVLGVLGILTLVLISFRWHPDTEFPRPSPASGSRSRRHWPIVVVPAVVLGGVIAGSMILGQPDDPLTGSPDPDVGLRRSVWPSAGVAVSFPRDWVVDAATPDRHSWLFDDAVDGAPGYWGILVASGGGQKCSVSDMSPWSQLPPAFDSVDDAVDYAVRELNGSPTCRSADGRVMELAAGSTGCVEAVFDDDLEEVRYYYSDGSSWFMLSCWSYQPPDDGWSSVADTFEFLDPRSSPVPRSTTDLVIETTAGVPAEVWDPATRSFSLTGAPIQARFSHVAARLSDGQVLIVGGGDPSTTRSLATAETWDPASGEFRPAGTMAQPRTLPGLSVLADGDVLISGGSEVDEDGSTSLGSLERWDRSSATFGDAGLLIEARSGHSSTLLPSGAVLLAGGYAADLDGTGTLASTEVWYPQLGRPIAGPRLESARSEPAAARLPDGTVLLAGGTTSAPAELVDPVAGTTASLKAEGRERRFGHTASSLPDGRVLLVGGAGRDDAAWYAEVWDPETGAYSDAGFLPEGRYKHTATVLDDGRVLVVGGRDDSGKLASAWLWDPASSTFEAAGTLTHARSHHTATLLEDGRVLVVGGADAEAD